MRTIISSDRLSWLTRSALSMAAVIALSTATVVLLATGCASPNNDGARVPVPPPAPSNAPSTSGAAVPVPAGTTTNSLALQAGDAVKIAFPGAPSLDTTQVIRRDGKITLTGIGEFQAAGLTPMEMQKQLLKAYGPQLVTPEVSVTVQSAAFIVYLTGAVAKPGLLTSDRHVSPLEAVIEAGVDLTKANLKAVRIIRTYPDGRVQRYKINLRNALKGKSGEPFALEPLDIIYVPEKFTWF